MNLQAIRGFVLHYKVWFGAVLLVVLGGLFFAGRRDSASLETLRVTPADFQQQVSVSGKVVAAQDVDLGFTQGGRVALVNVEVGDRVAAGAVIAALENGDFRAAVLQRQSILDSQNAKLASLKVGTRPEQIAVTESQVESSKAGLIEAIRDAYRAADNAVHNTSDQFFDNPRTNPKLSFSLTDTQLGLRVESERVEMEMILSAWQRSVAVLGVGDPSESVDETTHYLAQVASFLSDANDALNHAIPTLSISSATVDGWITSVSTVRTAVNGALSAVTSASTALTTQRKTLTLQQAGATAEDIAAQEAQVQGAQADLESARAQLQKTLITAPFSGVVTTVNAKVGSIASPDMPQISMISGGTFQVETYIPEISIVNVKVGNTASVRLDAYGDTPFEAVVVSIDPAETIRDGVSTYKTTLQFSKADPRIKSGMTADTAITTATLKDAIVIPQGAIGSDASGKFVTVVTGRGREHRAIEVGISPSLGQVQVLSGLSAGDVILLKPES